MSDDVSNATLLAEIKGLDRFMRLSVEHLQERIEPLVPLPQRVATLEAQQKATDAAVEDLKKEVKEDREGGRNRLVGWAAFLSASIVGLGLVIEGLIQLVR